MAGYQILGIRSFFDEQTRKQKKYDAFFEQRWRFDDFAAMLADPKKVLDENKVPDSERWNLFYTVAVCGDAKRSFSRGEILPFDIDGLDITRVKEYIAPVIKTLKLDLNKTAIVFSGNGLHFLVKLYPAIDEKGFYNERRGQYKAICAKINAEFERLRLPGKADTAVFDPARILRFPITLNRKPDKADPSKLVERMAEIIQSSLEPQVFDFDKISEQPKLDATLALPIESLKKYKTNDGVEAFKNCNFLAHVKENAASIPEPEWYAAASIIGRFDKGREQFHEISRAYPSYRAGETDEKLDQAVASSGPRTCEGIDQVWGGCKSCPLYQKISSPVVIFGKDVIPTEATGFYDLIVSKEGAVKRVPNYDDLLAAFERDFPFFIDQTTSRLFVFNGKKYVVRDALWLGSWCEQVMSPKPTQKIRNEFAAKVFANNYKPSEEAKKFFNDTINGKVNLFNGVYDVLSGQLAEHSRDYGFTYVLPYSHAPGATATTFLRFLDDVTLGRKELQDTLLDYMAYSFIHNYPDHCFLWLSGTGRNGKSTLTDLMMDIVGEENCAHVMLDGFEERFQVETMNGKLLNIGEEADSKKIPAKQLSMLKGLSAGAPTLVEAKGERPYTMQASAKLVFMANDPPKMGTANQALKSRLLLVPFDKQLEGDDFCIIDSTLPTKLKAELPGIFNLLTSRLREKLSKGPYRIHRNEISKAAMSALLREGDALLAWLEDYCEFGAEKSMWPDDAYAHYSIVVGGDKFAGNKEGFSRRISNLKPGKVRTEVTWNKEKKGSTRKLFGLGFKVASPLRDNAPENARKGEY